MKWSKVANVHASLFTYKKMARWEEESMITETRTAFSLKNADAQKWKDDKTNTTKGRTPAKIASRSPERQRSFLAHRATVSLSLKTLGVGVALRGKLFDSGIIDDANVLKKKRQTVVGRSQVLIPTIFAKLKMSNKFGINGWPTEELHPTSRHSRTCLTLSDKGRLVLANSTVFLMLDTNGFAYHLKFEQINVNVICFNHMDTCFLLVIWLCWPHICLFFCKRSYKDPIRTNMPSMSQRSFTTQWGETRHFYFSIHFQVQWIFFNSKDA